MNTSLEVKISSSSSFVAEIDFKDELEVFRDFHIGNMHSTLSLKKKNMFGSKEILLKLF